MKTYNTDNCINTVFATDYKTFLDFSKRVSLVCGFLNSQCRFKDPDCENCIFFHRSQKVFKNEHL